MESTSTPRISAALLESYTGQNVIIVGKVLQLRGDIAFLESDGQVQANLNRVSRSRALISLRVPPRAPNGSLPLVLGAYNKRLARQPPRL